MSKRSSTSHRLTNHDFYSRSGWLSLPQTDIIEVKERPVLPRNDSQYEYRLHNLIHIVADGIFLTHFNVDHSTLVVADTSHCVLRAVIGHIFTASHGKQLPNITRTCFLRGKLLPDLEVKLIVSEQKKILLSGHIKRCCVANNATC